MKKPQLLIATLFSVLTANCVQNNPQITVAVIVPCYSPHAIYLPELLTALESQSMLPSEVVISLSSASSVNAQFLKNLQSSYWAFPVTLIISNDRLFAGQNRNIACSHAKSTVFMCQDADDIPHPDRVKIICHFFEKYNADLVCHGYTMLRKETPITFIQYPDLGSIEWEHPEVYSQTRKYITNGNISIRRNVFDQFHWGDDQRAQDTKFNTILFQNIPLDKRITVFARLYVYRHYLSSSKIQNSGSTYQNTSVFAQSNIKRYPIKVIFNTDSAVPAIS